MDFDFRIIGIFTVLLLLIIAIAIITGLSSKVAIPADFLRMQIGIG